LDALRALREKWPNLASFDTDLERFGEELAAVG